MRVLRWFQTGPDRPVLEDAAEVRRVYERKRRSVFWTLVIGYSFFYVCRSALAVAKKPMIDAGFVNADDLGRIGSALLLTYAVGKFVNGFLADRSHIGRFMSTGLLVSAGIVFAFGFHWSVPVLVTLWAIHGWFQSMGAAPSGAAIAQWFSNRERGTRYSIWSTAHSIGEGLTFAITATIVSHYGYREGFWTAGAVSAIMALLMFRLLADRPQTYGLPPIADYKDDHTQESREPAISVRDAQLEVVKNPYVWVLGLCCMAIYVARYGINSWGVIYLQEAKGYPLISAGMILFWAKLIETLGALSSGIVSDFFFRARRNVTTLLYGCINIAGLAILFLAPSTFLTTVDSALAPRLTPGPLAGDVAHALRAQGLAVQADATVVESLSEVSVHDIHVIWQVKPSGRHIPWTGYRVEYRMNVGKPSTTGGSAAFRLALAQAFRTDHLTVYKPFSPWHFVGLATFGFGLGGLLVFLGGLIAIDICSKRAAGAAMGFVGFFAYVGASIQDRISGALIEAGRMTQYGAEIHDFHRATVFWFSAAVVSVALYLTLWRVKARD